MSGIDAICARAREASLALAPLPGEARDAALRAMAEAVEKGAEAILAANAGDVEASRGQIPLPLLKRLGLDAAKVRQMAEGVRAVAALPDPVGRVTLGTLLDEGLRLRRVTCPIGVIAAVFESRPDALVQIASLCLKAGNASILKGGREAARTNRVLADLLGEAAARQEGVPRAALQLLEAREEVEALLARDDAIDLIVPRGSNEFVRHIKARSRIPVLGHADGVCHLYVDRAADIGMAVALAVDAKTQYAAVCNAIETLLVHREAAPAFLPRAAGALRAKGVELRGCERTRAILRDALPASEADWKTEYLDLVLSVRVVDDLGEAIAHINRYGSRHTDAIVTGDAAAAREFMRRVDAASVMWNASTRFADGFRYGFGAEVGIATDKIHARGPVGLEGLVTYKYQVEGEGHCVAEYDGEGARPFLHRPLPPEPGTK
ncbi:MAG: glutamate-5-semialdehyde dehydrogenase [Candidatus Tectomicrobia bacterium]|uniref:Gamma-glutamyl phosphate reductase n=1 Tax=Tectimicrobiota bacterium TaxID=2528274 RepID=A0A932MM46_UNCTE|nr:glutamate-5-semialdehyde dehydrogenase [Candidatus Tectomicrobia bacterium]